MRRSPLALCSLVLLVLIAQGAAHVRGAPGREPVIVMPGLAGSEFTAERAFHLSVDDGHGGTYTHDYSSGEKVWVNTFQIALPGADDYLDALKLQPDGQTPVAPDLAVSGVYQSTYGDLIDYLQRQGYVLGQDLFVFPFDWRRDMRSTTELLDAQVTRALVAANSGQTDTKRWQIHRVDLVAHSMGGLLGRAYIGDPARAARVDQLITFGSPQLGAVKLLKGLLYGDDFGTTTLGLGLNPDETKDLIQNMPGPIQLLPSRSYYHFYDNSDAAHASPFLEDRDLNGDGVADGLLGFDGVRRLLLDRDANRTALDLADAFQSQFDGRRLYLPLIGSAEQAVFTPTLTVRWRALIGYGYGTPGQLHEYNSLCGGVICTKTDELDVDGDGTAALMSVALGDPRRGQVFTSAIDRWYANRTHSGLLQRDYLAGGIPWGDGAGLEWLGAVLRDESPQAIPGISSDPPPGLTGLSIAALGPAALRVTSPQGQQVGRAPRADPTPTSMPGATYDRLPDGEFAFLGQLGGRLEIAAERPGSVDVKLRVWDHGRLVHTAVYLGLQLGPAGRATLDLPAIGDTSTPARWPALRVDADGDGTFEATQSLTALLDERESLDTTAPAIELLPPTAPAVAGSAAPAWRARDDGAGTLRVLASVDGGPLLATAQLQAALAPGPHALRIVAQDRAGNVSSREFVWSAR